MKTFGATITKLYVQYSGGIVRIEYDYNDVTNLLMTVRGINNSASNACAEVYLTGGTHHARIFTANSGTTTISVPQTGGNRVPLTFNSKGQVDNVDGIFMWPYNGTSTPCTAQ